MKDILNMLKKIIYIYTGPNTIVIHQFSELQESTTANKTKTDKLCGVVCKAFFYRYIISHDRSTMKILGRRTR